MMSMWPAPGVFCRACDRPMPIEESAMAGQKIGTFARYAAVRMPSRSVVFHRCPPRRYSISRDVYGRFSIVDAKSAIQLSFEMNSSSLA